jgi:2-keto-4-pentenoate hydratase/2-oxohepta-3-ene-1,7-dioic acid hydratase in catechol pathway
VEFLTLGTTVEKGTLVVSGTPDGVGNTRNPQVVLQDGDNVTVAIEQLGQITNMVNRKAVAGRS